jgi:hypothetical protein
VVGFALVERSPPTLLARRAGSRLLGRGQPQRVAPHVGLLCKPLRHNVAVAEGLGAYLIVLKPGESLEALGERQCRDGPSLPSSAIQLPSRLPDRVGEGLRLQQREARIGDTLFAEYPV